MNVSWVYRLSKQQLREELRRHLIDSDGSLALLRQRLICYFRPQPEIFDDKPEDAAEYKEEAVRSRNIELIEQEFKQLRQQLGTSTPQHDATNYVTASRGY